MSPKTHRAMVSIISRVTQMKALGTRPAFALPANNTQ